MVKKLVLLVSLLSLIVAGALPVSAQDIVCTASVTMESGSSIIVSVPNQPGLESDEAVELAVTNATLFGEPLEAVEAVCTEVSKEDSVGMEPVDPGTVVIVVADCDYELMTCEMVPYSVESFSEAYGSYHFLLEVGEELVELESIDSLIGWIALIFNWEVSG
jgi:hypothetical protein